jgi:hypothetical protein
MSLKWRKQERKRIREFWLGTLGSRFKQGLTTEGDF